MIKVKNVSRLLRDSIHSQLRRASALAIGLLFSSPIPVIAAPNDIEATPFLTCEGKFGPSSFDAGHVLITFHRAYPSGLSGDTLARISASGDPLNPGINIVNFDNPFPELVFHVGENASTFYWAWNFDPPYWSTDSFFELNFRGDGATSVGEVRFTYPAHSTSRFESKKLRCTWGAGFGHGTSL